MEKGRSRRDNPSWRMAGWPAPPGLPDRRAHHMPTACSAAAPCATRPALPEPGCFSGGDGCRGQDRAPSTAQTRGSGKPLGFGVIRLPVGSDGAGVGSLFSPPSQPFLAAEGRRGTSRGRQLERRPCWGALAPPHRRPAGPAAHHHQPGWGPFAPFAHLCSGRLEGGGAAGSRHVPGVGGWGDPGPPHP